jgi:hypothetical protein
MLGQRLARRMKGVYGTLRRVRAELACAPDGERDYERARAG